MAMLCIVTKQFVNWLMSSGSWSRRSRHVFSTLRHKKIVLIKLDPRRPFWAEFRLGPLIGSVCKHSLLQKTFIHLGLFLYWKFTKSQSHLTSVWHSVWSWLHWQLSNLWLTWQLKVFQDPTFVTVTLSWGLKASRSNGLSFFEVISSGSVWWVSMAWSSGNRLKFLKCDILCRAFF